MGNMNKHEEHIQHQCFIYIITCTHRFFSSYSSFNYSYKLKPDTNQLKLLLASNFPTTL